MKPLFILAFFILLTNNIYPQVKTYLRGKVVYTLENNVEEPQAGITVFIEGTGDRDKTDHNGIFKIFLNKNLNPGDKVTFAIEKEGWAIRDPLFGEERLPSDPDKDLIKLYVLPKGSPLFKTDAQLKQYIEYTVLKKLSDNKSIIIDDIKPNLESLIETLTNKYGFDPIEWRIAFNTLFDKTLKDTSGFYEKGLVEFARENFNRAAGLFNKSAEKRIQSFRLIDLDFNNITEKRESLIKETARDLRLAGESYYKIKNYDLSLIAYKNAIEFLEYTDDSDELASTINEIARCYYYLSMRSTDEKIFVGLDSAEFYFKKGLELSRKKLLETWEWIFEGNLATIVAARSRYSSQVGKQKNLLLAIQMLETVEGNSRDNFDSNLRFMSKNNIGVCYSQLYEMTDSLDLALSFLDSSITSYSIISDSSFEVDYPVEWAYVNTNLGLSLITKALSTFRGYQIPSLYLELLSKFQYDTQQDFLKCVPDIFDNDRTNRLSLVESAKEKFAESERQFKKENRSLELANVLGSYPYSSIILMTYSGNYLTNRLIIETDSIINKASDLAKENKLIFEEINSTINLSLLTILKCLYNNDLDIQQKLAVSNNMLEMGLHKRPLLKLYTAKLKNVLLLNYVILALVTNEKNQKQKYLDIAYKLNREVYNLYTNLGYKRNQEEIDYLFVLINCYKNVLEK